MKIPFEKNYYNYYIIPQEAKTTSFLENYNKYLKSMLRKKRIINWLTFTNFIKEESIRSLEKLSLKDEFNISIMKKRTKFKDRFNNEKF